jgi:TonB-dependent receptor
MLINLYYNRSKLAFIFSILFFLIFQQLYAQGSGSIKGKILDKDTGDPLTGANVFVQNTSVGAASDLDGNFYIPTVPAGQHTLVISYIGYHKLTVDINVTANQTLNVEYRLEAVVLPGEEVLVTAQAVGQIEAINQQLSSNTIKNVVSETRIQELPDFNAAEAIGRLPGVSTQRSSGEGNKVVIRGLSPKHNLIAINHLELGATGKDDRSVDLTMITPYMLKAIEVFKAVTPDMDGDAIGGYVNMQLREAPSDLHYDLLWQSGYTKFNSKYDNYKAFGSVSNRFFNDKLGVFVLGNIEQVNRSSDNYNASFDIQTDVPPVPVYVTNINLKRHLETRKRYGANVILDYKLPNGKIMGINFFSRLNSDYTDYTTNYAPNTSEHQLNYKIEQGNSNTDIIANAIQGDNDFGFMSLDYTISSNYSRNNDPDILVFNFRQLGAVPSATADISPEDFITATNQRVNFEQTWLENAGRNTADYKENRYTGALNLKFPFNLSGLNTSGFLKIGGKYRYTHRYNDQNNISARIFFGGDNALMDAIKEAIPSIEQDTLNQQRFYIKNFTNSDPDEWKDFLDDRFGDLRWVPQSNKLYNVLNALDNTTNSDAQALWFSGATQLLQNDYNFLERYSAGYAMTELNFGPSIMVLGGVRYENDDREFTGYQMKDPSVNPAARITSFLNTVKVTSKGNNHFFLPMFHFKYEITDWMDFRYAYTQTLSRPDFIALTPAYFINSSNNYTVAGNPNLKPARAYNHDIVVSLYNNELGLFTAGGFYKSVDNFIWQTQYVLVNSPAPGFLGRSDFRENPVGQVQTWLNNKYEAEIYGIEFDWQTRFWYLPFPVNGIVLNLNYSHLWSNTKYQRALPIISPITGVTTGIIDTFRVGRVQDTPADIFNASFGYDYGGFSGRISFIYWGEVISFVGRRDEVDSRTEDYFRIDISIRQKLPLDGLSLYLNLNNINERKDEATQKTKSFPTNQQYYGFTGDLGLRYTL